MYSILVSYEQKNKRQDIKLNGQQNVYFECLKFLDFDPQIQNLDFTKKLIKLKM